ncbi:MAG: hypothetical protein RML12_04820 [Xanthomonadales bacterium]|nr:hypothetical protein [Xanthomonadales bacterium]
MRKHRVSVLSAAVGAALLFSAGAEACTLNAWTVNGSIVGSAPNLVPGGPGHTNNTVKRYSGVCGMRALASGNYVQNDDPANDQIFRARFYVFTGITGGSATAYLAGNSTNNNEIEVIVNRASNQLQVRHRGGSPVNFTINSAGRWYSVEVAMNATGTATTGTDPIPANTMVVRVSGANTGVTDTITSQSLSVTSGAAIDFARLGWVSGSATAGSDGLQFDAYESTRSAGNPIGRLCRGNMNADTTRNILDLVQIANNINGTFSGGQPDVNEDGQVNVLDMTVLQQIISSTSPGC